MNKAFPDRALENLERENNAIYPYKRKDIDYAQSVKATIEKELEAAKKQAVKWCNDDKNRCNKVEVRVRQLTNNGEKSVAYDYFQFNKWSENKILKEWKC